MVGVFHGSDVQTETHGGLVTCQDHAGREQQSLDLNLDQRGCKAHSIRSSTWKSSNELISGFVLFLNYLCKGRAPKSAAGKTGQLC